MKKSGFGVFSDRRPAGPAPDAKVWLVKSGDRILGPFSSNEIIERLRSRDTVLIDEVITPLTRWRVIRDEPIFRAVIEEIRRGQLSMREDTEIQGYTGSGVTQSTEPGTSARTKNDLVPTTLPIVPGEPTEVSTATNSGVVLNENFSHDVSTQPVQDAVFVEHVERPAASSSTSQVRQYGVSGTPSRRRASPLPKLLWGIAGVAVLTAGVLVIRARPGAEDRASGSFASLVERADHAWHEGDFQTSLKLLKEAERKKPGQADVAARLAPLLVRYEGQTAQAKRLAEAALSAPDASTMSAHARAALETSLGLCGLVSDDLAEAQTHLDLANAVVNGEMPSAHFDAGVVAFRRKTFDVATREFGLNGNDPAARLMIARSLFAVDRPAPSALPHLAAPAASQAEDAITKVIVESQDFLQEAHLLKAALGIARGDTQTAASEVRLTLDTDPDLTRDHRHAPYADLAPLEWRELAPECQMINDALKSTQSKALLSLCLFKSGDRDRANKTLSEALGTAPEDGYLQSVNAFALAGSDRQEDALAALKLLPPGEHPVLADLVRARVCQRTGDNACSLAQWTSLAERQPPVIAADVALAEVAIRSSEPAKAQELLAKARGLSPNYLPVLNFQAGPESK